MTNNIINKDTIKLLDNCYSGIIMGIESIKHVYNYANSEELKNLLMKYNSDHEKLKGDISRKLTEYNVDASEPNPISRAMSWINTNFKITTGNTDCEIAEIMHDGCNMGIKSISKYLNKYTNAYEDVKKIAKDIIKIEDEFLLKLRKFL